MVAQKPAEKLKARERTRRPPSRNQGNPENCVKREEKETKTPSISRWQKWATEQTGKKVGKKGRGIVLVRRRGKVS